jgi:hypothetical protein
MRRVKNCNKCKTDKCLHDFYAHPQMMDGYLNACKECIKKATIKRRLNNLELYRKRDRLRQNEPNRVAARKQYASSVAGKESSKAAKYRWAQKNKDKRIAQLKVHRAIRPGKLTKQPCEICFHSIAEAHHEDYSKPLSVIWLCDNHHKARHKELREQARNLLIQ